MLTRFIPNLFTLGNLFLGMLAILLAINEKYSLAAIMIIIAMLLDGLDGRVARALNAQSEFGKELDSLSDMVSFGAAPALIIFMVSFQDATPIFAWIATAAFPICGAIRLARFNVRPGIPGYFTGLPIPAAGGVLATLSLFHKDIGPISMMIATLLLSYLMVSSLKYPNFKRSDCLEGDLDRPVGYTAGGRAGSPFPGSAVQADFHSARAVCLVWHEAQCTNRGFSQSCQKTQGREIFPLRQLTYASYTRA